MGRDANRRVVAMLVYNGQDGTVLDNYNYNTSYGCTGNVHLVKVVIALVSINSTSSHVDPLKMT